MAIVEGGRYQPESLKILKLIIVTYSNVKYYE